MTYLRNIFIALCLLSTSCATYQHKASESRQLLETGQREKALLRLKELADRPGKDQLVHVLDYATALQYSNKFELSNYYFNLADQLSENNDYHSISKITSSVLLSEEMLQYKGDNHEKVLINIMKIINFSMLGNQQAALIETKKTLEKLESLKFSKEIKNSFLPFIHYMNALVWEVNGAWDDAYIDYKSVYSINPHFPNVKRDLYRLAVLSQRPKAVDKWAVQVDTSKVIKPIHKNNAEVIVVYQQGWGPRKYPSRRNNLLPVLRSVSSNTSSGYLQLNQEINKNTNLVLNIEQTSVQSLDEQLAPLFLKRVGAVAGKKVLAHQVYKKDKALGLLTDLLMSVTERADLRHWSLLPKSIQLVRMHVPPGTHLASFTATGKYNEEKVICNFGEVVIKSNEKKILSCRGF